MHRPFLLRSPKSPSLSRPTKPTITTAAYYSACGSMGLSMFSPEQQPVSLSPIWSKSIRFINETIATRLPPWFSKIKDPRQQKLFFRSWMACWLCIVLMLPSGSLVIVGNRLVSPCSFYGPEAHSSHSVFFAAIVCILTPPNLPIQPFLMVSIFSTW